MLDFFLVLGLIPGTSFQITFWEIVIAGLLLLGFIFRARLRRSFLTYKPRLAMYFKQRLWLRRQLSLPL